MKKLLLIIALVMSAVLPSAAQNANRNGFFIEAGAGFLTGKTPRVSLTMDANRDVYLNFAHGMAVDLYLGMRFRIHSHWAYEFRLGATAPLDAFTTLPTPKVFPVGFRYTSGELFGNMSLYAHLNLGGALTAKGYAVLPEKPGTKPASYSKISGGPAFCVGLGMNITTHFYAGLVWDSQYILKSYREMNTNGYENIGWGIAGIRLGYRF